MKTDELREQYLAFFEQKGCVRRPSDVLVPRWDPSLLFTNAGMNQFKDVFLGRCKLDFTRATTCQKCYANEEYTFTRYGFADESPTRIGSAQRDSCRHGSDLADLDF
jgi:hypothetical protein